MFGTVGGVLKGAAEVRLDGRADDVVAVFPETRVDVVVGDRVTVESTDDGWELREVEPRRSVFSRVRGDFTRFSSDEKREQVIAANVDLVVIVSAAAHPPFRPRQLDRYLILADHNEVTPIVCVNKIDVASKLPDLSTYEALGYRVLFVSATTGEGVDELRTAIAGSTSVFVGSSGVGKSSLLNAIVPGADLQTGTVGRKSPRGRHTTTRSALLTVDDSTTIIDTPGIRALEILEIDRGDIHLYFRDLAAFAPKCRFRDCVHLQEPGCAVLAAVESGEVAKARYDSYVRVMQRARS